MANGVVIWEQLSGSGMSSAVTNIDFTMTMVQLPRVSTQRSGSYCGILVITPALRRACYESVFRFMIDSVPTFGFTPVAPKLDAEVDLFPPNFSQPTGVAGCAAGLRGWNQPEVCLEGLREAMGVWEYSCWRDSGCRITQKPVTLQNPEP